MSGEEAEIHAFFERKKGAKMIKLKNEVAKLPAFQGLPATPSVNAE